MNLALSDTISRSTRIAQRLFEDRMLVITAKDSMLHRFNEVGTYIWQLLENPMTAGAISFAVGRHFEGFNAGEHTADLLLFIEALEKKGCVEILRKTGG